ncbi:MAG: ferric reductase-like transmembrane domain-containing protein [Candidatus Saccharibacteria bacterium]
MTSRITPQSSKKIGPVAVWASVGFALFLWALVIPLNQRIISPAATWKSIANICAFSGTVLYAWSVVLSARWRWTEGIFGGLDKAYHWHHLTGGLSFLLLAMHPLFLTIMLLGVNPEKISSLWLLTSDWQKNFGIISLYSIALALPVTVFLRMRYQIFILVHRILGFVFFAGFLHAFMAHGNISKSPVLWLYMAVVCLAAMYAFLYHSVLGRLLPRRYQYTVSRVDHLSDSVIDIRLEPKGKLLSFIPGQFAFVSFMGHPVNDESHPYSIASNPRTSQLRFVVKVLGDYTASLLALKAGTTAMIEGPHGGFSYKNVPARRQVWIAGGIGVTPFLSMAQSLPVNMYDIDFYYCVVNETEGHFDADFQAVARANPRFKAHLFCQDKAGFMNADFLAKSCDLLRTDFLICGPPPMMHAIHDGLIKLGVSDKHIHFEDFGFR